MGKKKTVTKNDPWAPAQPYILHGMQQTQRVFDQQQPQLDKFSGMAFDTYGKLNPGAVSGIQASQGLVNDTLGGKFLQGNPYLDAMISQQAGDIANNVNSQFTLAGRYGSGAHAGVLAKQTAEASDRLRFQNYGMERQNQINAVGQAQDLMRGNAGLLDQAAALPWTGVAAQTGNIRQASNGYGTTTTTTHDPWGTAVGLAGAAATAAPAFSDPRIKSNVKPIGQRPDGLGVYEYDNNLTGQRETGVMADEVAKSRPDALGPTVGGLATVDYAKLGADAQALTPKVQKPGLMGALDRVMNPDSNTTLGKVGIMGQALMAGSGGAFAPLGQALMGVRQEQERLADRQHEQAIERRMADAAELRAANMDNVGDTANMRDFEYFRSLPEGPEKELMRQMMVGRDRAPTIRQIYDPNSPTGLAWGEVGPGQNVPAGRPVAPRVGRSGGLTANMRATLKAQAAAAIAKGADPAKVRARLREMGVE